MAGDTDHMTSSSPPDHPLARHALVDRRAFLLRAAALAAGPAAVVACSNGTTRNDSAVTKTVPSAITAPSTSTTLTPVLYRADEPYWMQGNYAPVQAEVELFDLDVTGTLPDSLTGLYVRNGSNPAGVASPHWFLGDGMVHGVRLERGKAIWYRNRYIRTPMYSEGTDFLGNGAPGGAGNQSNVSVFSHAGKLLTSGEVGFPYQLDPSDLSTTGVYDFGGALQTAMTAHPKIDPVTGKMHFFGYGFVPPYLTYHVADPDGTLIYSAEIAVPGPTMIHDFAITDTDAIFWDLPVVFDLAAAIAAVDAAKTGDAAGSFPFRWDPTYGARIGIMPLAGPATSIRWIDIDPCYVFHGVNAHRVGDEVIIDVCRLPSMFAEKPDERPNAIHRWTVNTGAAALTFHDEVLSDEQMDLPALDRRRVGRANQQTWFLHVDKVADSTANEFAGISRRDTRTGAMDRYEPGERVRMNEGTFVPDGTTEGEGWLLAYGWDRSRGASDLMVFDAMAMAKGPIAAVHLPVRVPYGFHGWWMPEG